MTAAVGKRRSRTRRAVRLFIGVLVLVGLGAAWWSVHQAMPGWYARFSYPLRYEDTINREAKRHALDPALIAAVINVESKWVPDTVSSAGAVGLMQLLPNTAAFIARQPKRPSPPPDELTDPEINITYGSWYLRYLVTNHRDLPAALAAYNAGDQNVRIWEQHAKAEGRGFDAGRDIPFPETREFVRRVLRDASVYRRAYSDELGWPVPGLARISSTSG